MLVQVPLEVVVNVAFQCGRAGVAEHPNRDLAAVVVPALGIDQDFHIAGPSVAGHYTGHFEIRRGFARGFNGDLGDRTNVNTVFNHCGDRYMRSAQRVEHSHKEFTAMLRAE